MASENFRGNVVRGSNSRIRHQSSGSSPIINLGPVADSQINLINGNRVTVTRFVGSPLEELLIVVVVMQSVKAC